jgi:stage III sporulation protein AH
MKRKQIIVLGLVLVIIAVGILQYTYGGSGESGTASGVSDLILSQGNDLEDIPGAAVYVDNSALDITDEALAQAQQPTGFFAEAKLERDKARSKQKEELKSIALGNDGAVEASATLTSAEAQEQLVAIIRRSETEVTIETLIKQRGFEDAMAYMSDTGNVDVIVKASSLSAQEVAQISDIVVRHANVPMENITVKNVN